MASKFQVTLQGRVLDLLEKGPKSIAQLSKELDSSYHSTRNAVRTLENDGLIRPTTYNLHRDVKYLIGSAPGSEKNSIQKIDGLKITGFLEHAGMKKNQASEASLKLAYYVARILKCAEGFKRGQTASAVTLNVTREQMETSLAHLKRAVRYYQEILDNPKNWSPDFLSRYPEDSAWNIELIETALQTYEGSDN